MRRSPLFPLLLILALASATVPRAFADRGKADNDDPAGDPDAYPATRAPAKKTAEAEEVKTPPTSAPAGGAGRLRPSTRGMHAALSLGPSFELKDLPTQFILEAAFAYHFSGGPSGALIAGVVGVGLGGPFTTFNFAARFAWDFQVLAAYGLYAAPFVQAGWRFTTGLCGTIAGGSACVGDTSESFFDITVGAEARLSIDDRWFVLARPIAIAVGLGGGSARSRYELLFGGGAAF